MKVTVVGFGYVGTVTGACLASQGHQVTGVDLDWDRISTLQSGLMPVYEPGLEELTHSALDRDLLKIVHASDFCEPLGEVVMVAVGTPQLSDGGADLGQVYSAINWIREQKPNGTTVVMKSTVPPGTGLRLTKRQLSGSGMRYVSNPEFLREGQAIHDWKHPDRVVVGTEPEHSRSVEVIEALQGNHDAPYVVTDITSAEMIKYASNAFLATRISFINEIAALCERVGASIDVVSEGLAMDSRTGSKIHAGVGYGGSCFPKDVRALDHLALTSDANVELLRSVIMVNNRQRLRPLYALRERFNGSMSGLRVAVLGLSFKPGTDDVREAPALDLIRALCDDGAVVSAYDPHANATARRHLPTSVSLLNDPLEATEGTRAAVLMTEWPQVVETNWQEIAHHMFPPRYLFDGRNALDPATMGRLGFEYRGVGRPCAANSLTNTEHFSAHKLNGRIA